MFSSLSRPILGFSKSSLCSYRPRFPITKSHFSTNGTIKQGFIGHHSLKTYIGSLSPADKAKICQDFLLQVKNRVREGARWMAGSAITGSVLLMCGMPIPVLYLSSFVAMVDSYWRREKGSPFSFELTHDDRIRVIEPRETSFAFREYCLALGALFSTSCCSLLGGFGISYFVLPASFALGLKLAKSYKKIEKTFDKECNFHLTTLAISVLTRNTIAILLCELGFMSLFASAIVYWAWWDLFKTPFPIFGWFK